MILALMLAAAEPMTAIDAERAFITDAHTIGQWEAFRKWSADEAVIFAPQPENAHEALKDAKNPPVAIFWWPGRSFVSCDGTLAVNTGPWVRQAGKRTGFFTTVWRKKDGEWRWIYDGGGDSETVRPEGGDIKPTVGACAPLPTKYAVPDPVEGFVAPFKTGSGSSADRTLVWHYRVDARGARQFVAQQWTGKDWAIVIHDNIPAPPDQ
jgi:hypothetical protein